MAAPLIVSLANQKGGVAKTTSVVSLAAALAEQAVRVLAIDLDAQACLTFSLGVDPDEVEYSAADVLLGRSSLAEAALPVDEGLALVPATIDLAGVESALLTCQGRELALHRALTALAAERDTVQRDTVQRDTVQRDTVQCDVVLLDCSPSLGLLTINALAASDEVIVPLQCEMLSHRGVGQLLDTVADIQRLLNPRLTVRGLLPTMYDSRSGHARAVLADVGERYGVPVLPPIPRSVRFAEAAGLGGSVLRTASRSVGARAYREVAALLIRQWRISSALDARPLDARPRAARSGAARSGGSRR